MIDAKLSSAKPRPKPRYTDRNLNRMIILAFVGWCLLLAVPVQRSHAELEACYSSVD